MSKALLAAVVLAPALTGCMGHNGLTGKAKKANLSMVENRWGREGIFLAFQAFYVKRICLVLDLFVFNSIEFWSGENPINDKPALVDLPMEECEKLGIEDVRSAQIERINDTKAKLYVDFVDGDHLSFDVLRTENQYAVSYQGKEFFQGDITN